MVDTKTFFKSLQATWVNRIRESSPEVDGWVQLPLLSLRNFKYADKLSLLYNFDGSMVFSELEKLPCFSRNVIKYYNSACHKQSIRFKNYNESTIMGK